MIAGSGILGAALQGGGSSFLQQIITFSVTGLATASVYAIASSGLVVTYTTSGIFNFAHGAFGMFAAFLYWQCSESADNGGWGLGTIPSIILVVFVIAPLFGALIERVVMRGLRGTSEAVRIVVTVGLMLAMLTIAPVIWPEDQARNVDAFFPGKTVMIAGVGISYHRITIMVVALLVALGLRLLLFSTRLGSTMRAVVDDPALARLNGIRPDSVSMASWALGSSLAALSGVLIASQSALNATTLTLLVVNAFAAAVFGRLTSLPRAFVGAIVLGMAEAWTVGFIKPGTTNALERWVTRFENTGWTVANLQPAMPAIVLFVVMWFTRDTRARSHSLATAREQFAVPTWGMAAVGSAALIAGSAMIGTLMSDGDLLSLGNGMLLAIVVLSLVPLTGYSGQICLAQMTFFGIGAVSMGHYGQNSVVLGVLAAIAISALVGALVALPALRLKGIYLALLTAAFATSVTNLIFKQGKVMPNGQIDVPTLFPAVASPYGRVVQMAVVFSLMGALVVGVRRSSLGRRLVAMKDTPEACQTLGMNLVGSKLMVFALSAAIAGLAGAVSGSIYTADQLALESSLAVTMLGVVGGIGSVGGAFFGGMMLGAFQSIFNTVFAINRIGWFSVWSLAVTDLLKVGPGLMGMNLGKNPTGAAPQIAEGFAPVAGRRSAAVASIAGAVVLWALAAAEVISNWSFVAALIVGLLGVAPLLAFALAPASERPVRAPVALGIGVAALAAVAFTNWESVIASNGWRVVAFIVLGAVLGRVLFGVAGIGDPNAVPEPDANDVYLDARLSSSELWEVERQLDLHEELNPPTGAGLGRDNSERVPLGVGS